MPERHGPTDEQRLPIAALFPAQRRGGRWADHRTMIDGARWRNLPELHDPWQAVYHRFNRTRRTGLVDRPPERLQANPNAEGSIDAEPWWIDGAVIQAARGGAGGTLSLARTKLGKA